MILDYFSDWLAPNTMAVEERASLGYDTKTGKSTNQEMWTPVAGLEAVPIWLYRRSSGIQAVDDKLKEATDVAILLDPVSLGGVEVRKGMRGVIGTTVVYFVKPDNILLLGEVFMIHGSEDEDASV